MFISSVTYILNMKKMVGMEIIENKANEIKCCYDFLLKKGICQYTHFKFTEKLDCLKDF